MTEFEDKIYSNFSVYLFKNDYEGMFASLESHLGKKPILYEYHCLYRICIDYIAEYYLALPYANDLIEKMNCIGQYNWFRHELDNIFNEYAAKIDKPSDMPMKEYMKNQDKLNIKIANFFDSFIKEKSDNFYDSIPEKLKYKIGGVILDFDVFYNDLPLLVERKFMNITEDKIICNNKSFLHDYFKDITPEGEKNTKWESVHKLFGVTGLNTAKSIDKDSRLFEQWKAIKQDISTCM
ncbi:MAG: hypothetical protein FWG27_03580 [Treponema sp.]|nr:hypothetical protein [Treponema sp.]